MALILPSLEICKMLNVQQSSIRVMNEEPPYVLVHYSAPDPTPDVGHVRGIIVNILSKRIVCKSFGYTPEVAVSSLKELPQGQFFKACEGTILRLWFDSEWRLSTHHKIDADASRWGVAPPFGELFESMRQFNVDDLCKDWCYSFLLSSPKSRLIYPVTRNQLILTSIYDTKTSRFVPSKDWKVPVGVCLSEKLSVSSLSDLTLALDKMDEKKSFDGAGILVVDDETDPHPIKLLSQKYATLKDARGNEADLRARLLEVKGTAQAKELEALFPDAKKSLDWELERLAKKLHGMYINYFVSHNRAILPKEEFVALRRCHQWYQDQKVANVEKPVVTLDKVKEIMGTTPAHFIVVMLGRL